MPRGEKEGEQQKHKKQQQWQSKYFVLGLGFSFLFCLAVHPAKSLIDCISEKYHKRKAMQIEMLLFASLQWNLIFHGDVKHLLLWIRVCDCLKNKSQNDFLVKTRWLCYKCFSKSRLPYFTQSLWLIPSPFIQTSATKKYSIAMCWFVHTLLHSSYRPITI